MSDGNYTFDPDSLSYEKAEPKKGKKFLISLISQVLAASVIGLVVFLTISYTIKTPRQKKMERENEVMQQEYNSLSEKYTRVDSVLKDIKQRDKDIYRAIFETELQDGEDRRTKREFYANILDDDSLTRQITAMVDAGSGMLKREESAYNELKYKLMNSKENLTEIPAILPVKDPEVNLIYYGFGKKLDPIYKTSDNHYGIDIAAGTGAEIFATANGVVEFCGDKREKGKHVVINHRNGYKTIYAHMSEFMVKNGQKVKRGDIIGFVGNTGKTLTPHLHYEIQHNGQPINPTNYFFCSLNPEKWEKLVQIANSRGLSLD
ncbi:MAG: M23 family metallopeptidase [Bacteroidales bacterium]|nr:M23 family metallopeptidase [Bacteroidales bacterium]